MQFAKFYVNGKWIKPKGKKRIEVINPATEEPAGHALTGTAADVDAAVSAARAARDSWSRTAVEDRVAYLRAIAEGLTSRGDELARIITMEMGMPSSICRGYQVDPPVMVIDSFIELLENFSFQRTNRASVTLLEPIGVCALITPWNFPLTQTMLKLAPALLAGCTVVLKPSEFTPFSASILAEIIDAAGLPPGVFNLVQGEGAEVGSALADHPSVDKISLTGSTRAGISVATHAAQTLKRVTLELGGKSPNIICDDADFEKVIPAGVRKCFSNSGQACDAPTRMLVPRSRYEKAIEIAGATAESMRTGDPTDTATELGPLVNRSQFGRVTDLIKAGITEGARLVTGGPGRPQGLERGFYVNPTVFAHVSNGMEIARQEIFGPVMCILPYTDDEEAIRIANDSPYGLAAYISSADDQRAAAIAKRLQAGQVRINQAPFDITAPFGGYKMSGYGRELGAVGLEEYLQIKACMGLV
jgi:aldehyde dehydrogenase (NAD+)